MSVLGGFWLTDFSPHYGLYFPAALHVGLDARHGFLPCWILEIFIFL